MGETMSKTVSATVVLLRDELGRVCLAPKKQNIHKLGQELKDSKKKWNGYGGKQDPGETILETAIRELLQESSVLGKADDLELVASVSFYWPGNETTEPDMVVHFFFLRRYVGVPTEGAEMGAPQFFHPDEIPYREMMSADKEFFTKILAGEKIVCDIHLRKNADGTDDYRFVLKQTFPTL